MVTSASFTAVTPFKKSSIKSFQMKRLSAEWVWPLPTHFTPRLLYKLKVDDSFVEPLPVMPWELVKVEKEGEEEERDDQQSASDSSD